MKLILLLVIIWVFSSSFCIKYKASFYLTEEIKHPQTTFDLSKGAFSKIYMHLTLDDTKVYQVKGDLSVPSPFQFSDPIKIDTLQGRLILIHLGLSCADPTTAGAYKVTFELKDQEHVVTTVDLPEITLNVNTNRSKLGFDMPLSDITAGGYGIYSVDHSKTLNVDQITVEIATIKGRYQTAFNGLVIPPYSSLRGLMFLKSTFSTGEITSGEEVTEQTGRVSITNACYQLIDDTISFTINTKPFADLNEETFKGIVESFHVGFPFGANIQVKMEMRAYPVFIYCSALRHLSSIETVINQMRKMNDYVKDFNEDFFMLQSFITSPQKLSLIFWNLNRYVKDFKVLCLIEDTNRESTQMKAIQFLISNDKTADKQLLIHPYYPQPSSCAIWSFAAPFADLKKFDARVLTYCAEAFATYNRDNGKEAVDINGCIQCELNPYYDGSATKPQKSICIRSRGNCPNYFREDPMAVFSSMTQAIDSKEKIAKELGVDSTAVELLEVYGDKDDFDKRPINATYIGTEDGDKFSFEASNILDRSISCRIKKKALRDVPIEYTDEFFEKDSSVISFKAKEVKPMHLNFEQGHSHQGYDDLPYSVFIRCFSVANDAHYYDGKPYIPLAILRTKEKPIEDEPVLKPDCPKTPLIAECLKYIRHKPLPFNNTRLFPEVRPELKTFNMLSYPYQTIMAKAELLTYEKMTSRLDIISQTIFLGRMLSIVNCRKAKDYSKCRTFKTNSMTRIIKKLKANYPCETLVKDITQTSALVPANIVQFALALFYLSNNPEAYSKETYPDIFSLTSCMYQNKEEWYRKINSYYLNRKIEKETNGDLLQLLITHSANLIQVVNYLEADGVIALKDKAMVFDNDFIKEMKQNMLLGLKDLLLNTKIKSIEYDSLYYVNFFKEDYIEKESSSSSRLRKLASDPKVYYITNNNIKVTMYPYDLFVTSNATYISFIVWNQYPLLPLNSSSVSPNVFSLKAYNFNQTARNTLEEMKDPSIKSYPKVRYDFSAHNSTFDSGCYFKEKDNEFVNAYSSYENVIKDKNNYGEISIKSFGDFTLGVNTTSYVWLIIILVVVGVLLLAGAGYFIFKCWKKKKENNATTSPLIPDNL